MSVQKLIEFQLQTSGPSATFLMSGSKCLVRQGEFLQVVNLQQKQVEAKIPMNKYNGQPSSLVDDVYYEVNKNALTSTNVETRETETVQVSNNLSATAFVNYNRLIFMISNGQLLALYLDTKELVPIGDFVPATNMFQYSENEMASYFNNKLHIFNTESHELKTKEQYLSEGFTLRASNDFVQLSTQIFKYDEIIYEPSATLEKAIPFLNANLIAFTGFSGLFELLQGDIFDELSQFCACLRFQRSSNIVIEQEQAAPQSKMVNICMQYFASIKAEIANGKTETEAIQPYKSDLIQMLTILGLGTQVAQETEGKQDSQAEIQQLILAQKDQEIKELQKDKSELQNQLRTCEDQLNQKVKTNDSNVESQLQNTIRQKDAEIAQLQRKISELNSKVANATSYAENTVKTQERSQPVVQKPVEAPVQQAPVIQIQKKTTIENPAPTQSAPAVPTGRPMTLAEKVAMFSKK
ncbi:Conserved_hypothetical protein [Hexamita inflata]|uniref:Uncharacterized protein n=1 Tax=Hexamita inflata TaxID=28002 RepID=A0AA86ULN8_9EUKA|nr:Conserved hypothetical protein [Hexamita inflata]